jgi:hypothetical protein
VGAGLDFLAHLTTEGRSQIEGADRVFMALGNQAMVQWILRHQPGAEPLEFYRERDPDRDTVGEWNDQVRAAIDRVLAPVRSGERVCVVLDGHPAVQTPPVHTLVQAARDEGLRARFLPGISAEASLFADLGLDPARDGLQSFEATDFLIRRRAVSVHSGLLLRQIGLIGEYVLMGRQNESGLTVLAEVLSDTFGPSHDCLIYEAAPNALVPARMEWTTLGALPEAGVTDLSTLYVPPLSRAPVDPDMLERLGISPDRIRDA